MALEEAALCDVHQFWRLKMAWKCLENGLEMASMCIVHGLQVLFFTDLFRASVVKCLDLNIVPLGPEPVVCQFGFAAR